MTIPQTRPPPVLTSATLSGLRLPAPTVCTAFALTFLIEEASFVLQNKSAVPNSARATSQLHAAPQPEQTR